MTRVQLVGVTDGRIDATADGTLLRENSAGFERIGEIPNPARGRERLRYELLRRRPWKPLLEHAVGTFSALTVTRLSETALVATAGRWLLASRDGGETWSIRGTLPDSSGPKGVLPTGICSHAGSVYLGEYPLSHETTPKLLRSPDEGWSWEVAAEIPGVRHIHSVQSDPYTGELWLTTGDRDGECRIGRFRGGEFETVCGGNQRFRAVELAFTPDAVLWGMDSVYASENHLLKLGRAKIKTADPTPEVVETLDGSVFYSAALDLADERWVWFSTSVEPGNDSTAPPGSRADDGTGLARVVGASSASGFTEWHEFAVFRRRRDLGSYWNPRGFLPRSSAYVHLASDPERGLVMNPFNTVREDGALVVVRPTALATSRRWVESTTR